MRVIKKGDKHLGVPKEITCVNCESVLEYQNPDIIDTGERRYVRKADVEVKVFKIMCPICKKSIKI